MKFSRLTRPMLASLTLLLALGSSAALGQTYVRPSKGVAFNPFPGSTLTGDPFGSYASNIFDWTAFTNARVQIFGVGTALNGAGVQCSSVTPIDYTYRNLNSYIKFTVQRSAFQLDLYLSSSGDKSGTFRTEIQAGYAAITRYETGVPNNEKFGSCTLGVLVTPLPFDSASSASSSTSGAATNVTSHECYPGLQTISTQALNSTAWTAIAGGDTSTSVCNSILNAYGPVYCVVQDVTLQGALTTPPNTLINSAYVIQPGECQQFGPSRTLTASGWYVDAPKPWCASYDTVTVGVRACSPNRINN